MKKAFEEFIIILVVLLTTISLSFAHHFWVEKVEPYKFEIKWGHPYKRVDFYNPQMIEKIIAYNLKGKKVSIKRINMKNKVILETKNKISLIAVLSKPKYYVVSITPEGKKKYNKMTKKEALKQGLQILDSFYSQQFAKSIFTYSDVVTKPLGLKFEIVPLKNPLNLKSGDILPIKVFFKGKPMEGLIIETRGHKKLGKTDKNGIAQVNVPEGILKVIAVRYRIPLKDTSKADYKAFTTVLTWK